MIRRYKDNIQNINYICKLKSKPVIKTCKKELEIRYKDNIQNINLNGNMNRINHEIIIIIE